VEETDRFKGIFDTEAWKMRWLEVEIRRNDYGDPWLFG
jgi:hypothetical protein